MHATAPDLRGPGTVPSAVRRRAVPSGQSVRRRHARTPLHADDLQEGRFSGAGIRSWAWLDPPAGRLLLLNIRGSRYCGNVGREHRSNGVFYVVDLEAGLWCQRCYDPDCRHWRSPFNALPDGVHASCRRAAAAAAATWQGSESLAPACPGEIEEGTNEELLGAMHEPTDEELLDVLHAYELCTSQRTVPGPMP